MRLLQSRTRSYPENSFIPVEVSYYEDFPRDLAVRNQAYTHGHKLSGFARDQVLGDLHLTGRPLIKGKGAHYCCGKHPGSLPMSLDLEPCLQPTMDSPRGQLKPLILVERVKQLQLQRGGSSAVCGPYQQEHSIAPSDSPQGVDFPRKVIINKPHSIFRAKTEVVSFFTIPQKKTSL